MSSLVEVQVLNHLIVLPCDESTTIADISAAAVAEYRSFNLKKSPQKVLYTRDSSGRILSGALKIIQNKIDSKLEVVIAEHTSDDHLNPGEVVALYRDWQLWVAAQIQEAIYLLSIQETPPHPDPSTLFLLRELCDSPDEKVQLVCVKILKTVLTKFSQKQLVVDAAEGISKLFMHTSHADVAVAAIESFKGLSPLQAKVFNSAKCVREMLDVQTALVRFSTDKQSKLFGAFETVSGIIGDQELNSVLNRTDEGFAEKQTTGATLQSFPPNQKTKRVNFLDEVENETFQPAVADMQQALPQTASAQLCAEPVAAFTATTKRINLKRLESLLSSDDPKVRLFALEKLCKLLSRASTAHSANMVTPAAVTTKAQSGTVVMTDTFSEEARDAATAQEYLFTFTDGKEVESIVKCLFRCLKQCIHSRPKRGAAPQRSEADAAGEPVVCLPVEKDSSHNASQRTATASSTAGRLIQTALHSPQTDEAAVLLIIDCLFQIAHFPADISLSVGAQFPPGVLHTHRRKLRMNGRELSNIQLVFILASREWYRLLLTLAHADEGSKLLRYADMAEKCAYFFVLVVLHGMEKGWREAELNLEGSALLAFLAGKQPSFRSYLGLSYLTSLSTSCLPDHHQQQHGRVEGAWSMESKQYNKESLESQVLQDLLLYRSAEVTRCLWRWVSEGTHSTRKSMLLALDCLSSCCAFSSFTAIMYKLDPITRYALIVMDHIIITFFEFFHTLHTVSWYRLAALLQLAVRDEDAERREFAVGMDIASRSQDRGARPARHALTAGMDSDADWDCGKDKFKVPVVPDDASDDEGVGSPTLDNMSFPGYGFGDAQSPAVPVAAEENALSRLMNRKGGINAAAAAVATKAGTAAFVYPDVPLIRLILKIMANLLNTSNSASVYGEDFRGELANWLLEVDIGPEGSTEGRVKLRRIAKRDQIVMFYFNSITQN